MPVQPIKRSYGAGLTLEELQNDMRYQERGYKAVTDLLTEDGKTVAIHDRRTKVPADSLELVLDPDGNATGSAGSRLIKRGKAYIQGEEKKVSAFRKAAAAAGGGGSPAPATPAPATPAPATPAPPAPATPAPPAPPSPAAPEDGGDDD